MSSHEMKNKKASPKEQPRCTNVNAAEKSEMNRKQDDCCCGKDSKNSSRSSKDNGAEG